MTRRHHRTWKKGSAALALLCITLLALSALLAAACGPVRPDPVVRPDTAHLEAINGMCRALWQDELGRDIDQAALADCGLQIAEGRRTLEDYRAQLRASDEYAARQARLEAERTPALVQLRYAGRQGFVEAPTGNPVPWHAVTGFQLVHQVHDGRLADADRFLASLPPAVRAVRVLTMARHLFQLTPAEGLAALPATLELAAKHGRYLEVVVYADTASYPGLDWRGHAAAVARACAASAACGFLEIGNELWRLHPTQHEALEDLSLLRSIREAMRREAPGVPVSLGSTHAGEDESERMADGDILTIHGDRADGDEIESGDDAGWRWVRHSNEFGKLADNLDKYTINDEPRRDDLRCDKQLGLGVLMRLRNVGDTFHFRAGLSAEPASGAEAEALACRSRGWQVVPAGWFGTYANAGFAVPRAPVKSFEGAVRVYSAVTGSDGFTLVLGAEDKLRLDWDESWPNRQLLLREGRVQVWRVTR